MAFAKDFTVRSTQEGSCVLVILTIMSMLLMFGLATYKSATYFEQFSLLRAAHEQQTLLARSLLEYGVLTIARNYQTVLEHKDPWSLHIVSAEYKGIIQISNTDEGVLLSAAIIEPEKSSNYHTCLLVKDNNGKIQVWGFQKG